MESSSRRPSTIVILSPLSLSASLGTWLGGALSPQQYSKGSDCTEVLNWSDHGSNRFKLVSDGCTTKIDSSNYTIHDDVIYYLVKISNLVQNLLSSTMKGAGAGDPYGTTVPL